jgi:metallo-beta-lactamase class B
MRRRLVPGVLVALTVAWASASAFQRMRPADVAGLPSKPADAREAYGSDAEQFGELRLPAGPGPHPVAVVIHGGCWISTFATLQSTAAMADSLRDAGLATWNVEYRRADQPSGGWPGTFADVSAAVDHLRVLATKYPLDLERVVFTGHSAGAHLALWAAARRKLPSDSGLRTALPVSPRAVVAIGGPGDITDFATYDERICGSDVIDRLMGATAAQAPDRYRQASPVELLPLGVRQVLAVGDSDGVMPERARSAYAAAARAAGDDVDVVVVPDAGHFEVIAPTTPAWQVVQNLLLEAVEPGSPRGFDADPPIDCDSCDEWNQPREPFRVFGDTYYVGTAGLSAVLITSDDGHILLDGALPQSAPLIDANIRRLGFHTSDIRLIVNSHAHFDHAGGMAALQRASGAEVVASPDGARGLTLGGPVPEDPQRDLNGTFPPVPDVGVIADGEIVRRGALSITGHFTPGHTPGGTTWTWRSCENERCVDIVYGDSLNAVSAPDFKFSAAPGLVDAFRRSIARVETLPCDVLVSVHPGFAGLAAKRQRQLAGAVDAFIDPGACQEYAATSREILERRLASER